MHSDLSKGIVPAGALWLQTNASGERQEHTLLRVLRRLLENPYRHIGLVSPAVTHAETRSSSRR
jgi:hypothetical protein